MCPAHRRSADKALLASEVRLLSRAIYSSKLKKEHLLMRCNLLGSTWYARTVTTITAIFIVKQQSLQNTPPTHSRQHCEGLDLFQSPTVGTTHSRQMNHRMPTSLDPSGPCGGRYQWCVVGGRHILQTADSSSSSSSSIIVIIQTILLYYS